MQFSKPLHKFKLEQMTYVDFILKNWRNFQSVAVSIKMTALADSLQWQDLIL